MNIIICTEDPLIAGELSEHIKTWAKTNDFQEHSMCFYQSNDDILERWENGDPIDILFIQDRMINSISGFELSHILLQDNVTIPIVLLTNSDVVDLQMYQGDPIRFLRVPFSDQEISQLFNSCWMQIMEFAKGILLLKGRGYILRIPFRSIRYIEHKNRHTLIYVTFRTEPYSLGRSLNSIASMLPAEEFLRCHKSYIVSKSSATGFHRDEITLLSKESIPVGRAYKLNVEQELSRR